MSPMLVLASSVVLQRRLLFSPVTCRLISIREVRCALCTMYSGLQPFLIELRFSLASYFLQSFSHIFAEYRCVRNIYSCCVVVSSVSPGGGCLT